MISRELSFVDTSFIVALAHTDDRYHQAAEALDDDFKARGVRRFTSECILIELADGFARQQRRAMGIALVQTILDDSSVDVVPATPRLFRAGWELYRNRADKEWGLTDCISFEVMRQRGITLALTVDRHFVQAGFEAPLLAGA